MPYTTLWILNITLITWNDVNVNMEDALPGGRPNVDADVVAVRFKLFAQQLLLLVDQRHAGVDLFGRQFEKAGNMTMRYDQRMPWTHCV